MINRHHHRSFAVIAVVTLTGLLAACTGTPPAPGGAAPATAVVQVQTAVASAATPVPATPVPSAAPSPSPAPSPTLPAVTPSAAQAQAPASSGSVIRIAVPGFPGTLDPQKSSYTDQIEAERLVFEGLTRFDKDLHTVPAAAESWQFNHDATAITFTLRSGLKYSDGSPLTAQDFANAVYRTIDPHDPGQYQTILNMIVGADPIIKATVPADEAKLPALRAALGVKVPDDRHIVFHFTQPTPYFVAIAGTWVLYPVKASLATTPTWWQDVTKQIGNGPWAYTKIDESGNLLEFRRNDNYWGTKPKADGIQWRVIKDMAASMQAYKSKEVDITGLLPPDVTSVKADPVLSKEYHAYVGSCTSGLLLNPKIPPFDNKKVREAFAYAYDRVAISRDMSKGTNDPTLTWIPPGYPGYDKSETRYSFDLAKAKATLAAAGYPDGKGLPPIKYSYSSDDPSNSIPAQYLAHMYQQNLGATITLEPMEGKMLASLMLKNATMPQMAGYGWCADYPDPEDWLSLVWNSSQQFAQALGYHNPTFDDLTNKADTEPDPAHRAALYDQAQKLLIGDLPMIMVSNSQNHFMVSPRLSGFDYTPQDAFYPGGVTALVNVTVGP